MKNFKEFIKEGIDLNKKNIDTIERAFKSDLEKIFGEKIFMIKMYYDSRDAQNGFKNAQFDLGFNLKHEMENVPDDLENSYDVRKENAQNLLIMLDKALEYFKKFGKNKEDLYIKRNNYTGLNYSVELNIEEIFKGLGTDLIKSHLTIDKFNL